MYKRQGFIDCIGNAVELKNNGTTILTTISTGISVTGNGVFSGSVIVPDAGQLQLGTGNDAQIYHDSSNFYAKNLVGQLNIDQAAVTQSIVFRVSDANALDVTALTINRSGDLSTGSDVTIAGDLTVNGTTTTVNSQTLSVDDPLISLAINNSANSLDIGYYGKYNDGTTRYLGLFNDASDSNKFKLFKGTTAEPTTTVNIGGAGYVAADLVVAGLEATTISAQNATFAGTVSATSFISTTDAGININGIGLTRVAANSAIRVADGLETLGLLRSYAALAVGTTGTFGGDVSLSSASSPSLSITDTTNAVTAKMYSQNSDSHIGTITNHPLVLDTNNTAAITIDTSQNVGVGTSDPNVKLRISGTQGNPATSGSTSTGFLSLYNESSSHGLMMGVQNVSPFGSWIQACLLYTSDAADE